MSITLTKSQKPFSQHYHLISWQVAAMKLMCFYCCEAYGAFIVLCGNYVDSIRYHIALIVVTLIKSNSILWGGS